MRFNARAGAGVEAARAGRGVVSLHSVSPEYDRAMLSAADLGGLRKPLGAGVAGVTNGVVRGGIEEGLASFEWWNRACKGRIDPGTGILLLVVLPIRGIRD